jgi:hypothetical protein
MDIPKGTLARGPQGQLVFIQEEAKPSWLLRIGIWAIAIGSILLVCVFVLRRCFARRWVALDR